MNSALFTTRGYTSTVYGIGLYLSVTSRSSTQTAKCTTTQTMPCDNSDLFAASGCTSSCYFTKIQNLNSFSNLYIAV